MSFTHQNHLNPAGPRERIGVVGLGLMGKAIAERLLGGGLDVMGWDTSPAQRTTFGGLGGEPAAGIGNVFTRCNRVILSLPDDQVVSAVLREGSDALHAGHVIIDSSTGSPEPAIALAGELSQRSVVYLDATVSGSSSQVRKGEVLLMVGGPKDTFDQCQDLFRLFANRVIHTGPCGSGAKMKLVTNLVLGLNRAALAEALVFAQALELDGDLTLRILRESMAYSRIMDTKGEKMLHRDFETQARLSQHLKDVRLMIGAAAKMDIRLPLSETHRRLLELAENSGFGDLDNSVIIQAIQQIKEGDIRA